MVIRLNNRRLSIIIKDYKECLESIEESFAGLNKYDSEITKVIERAFKADVIDLFKVIEDYTALVLKTRSIDVSVLYLNQALDKSVQFGYISKEFRENIRKHKILRYKYSHRYGQPTLEEIKEFYINSKELMEKQVGIMESLLKDSENQNIELKFY